MLPHCVDECECLLLTYLSCKQTLHELPVMIQAGAALMKSVTFDDVEGVDSAKVCTQLVRYNYYSVSTVLLTVYTNSHMRTVFTSLL
jgi:hypothetical protein